MLYQFDSSLHKCLDLAGYGEQQDPGDLICSRQLRIHRHTQMKIGPEQIDLPVIDGIAHPRDRMPCPQPLRQKTAQHIKLVCRSTGDHKIRMCHIRLLLNLNICSISWDTKNVKLIQSFL